MKTLTRQEAVEDIRRVMLDFVDDEHSMCEIATRFDIHCKGFSQWSFEQLKQRYDWIVKRRPNITREELERLANLWQLTRQEVCGTELSCDSQTLEHDTCHGWDEWDNEVLARLHREFCGEPVQVVDAEKA